MLKVFLSQSSEDCTDVVVELDGEDINQKMLDAGYTKRAKSNKSPQVRSPETTA